MLLLVLELAFQVSSAALTSEKYPAKEVDRSEDSEDYTEDGFDGKLAFLWGGKGAIEWDREKNWRSSGEGG